MTNTMTTNQTNLSLSQLKEVFTECVQTELSRPSTIQEPIKKFIYDVLLKLKVNTFFLPDSLAEFTEMIFKNQLICDFTFCLRDRFMIEVNGLGPTARSFLIECLTNYGDDFQSSQDQSLSLIPEQIPNVFKLGLRGDKVECAETLLNNTFLIVPLMIYLSAGSFTTEQLS